jgi:hypothetical protein
MGATDGGAASPGSQLVQPSTAANHHQQQQQDSKPHKCVTLGQFLAGDPCPHSRDTAAAAARSHPQLHASTGHYLSARRSPGGGRGHARVWSAWRLQPHPAGSAAGKQGPTHGLVRIQSSRALLTQTHKLLHDTVMKQHIATTTLAMHLMLCTRQRHCRPCLPATQDLQRAQCRLRGRRLLQAQGRGRVCGHVRKHSTASAAAVRADRTRQQQLATSKQHCIGSYQTAASTHQSCTPVCCCGLFRNPHTL